MTLLLLSVAWLAGLAAAAFGVPQAAWAAGPFGVGMAAGLLLAGRPWQAVGALACAGLAIGGAAAFEAARPPADPGGVARLNDGAVVSLRGVVADEPEERGTSQRLVLALREVNSGEGWRPESGRVQVTARAYPVYRYGDLLELRGRLQTPPVFEGFDYREYLAYRGVVSLAAFPQIRRLGGGEGSVLRATLLSVRDRLGDSLSRSLPEPEAALARGMLLGQRAAIPAGLTDDFNRAGISHLVAISGSNVTLVAALGLALLWPAIGRRRAALASMLLIAGFVLLVGASPSVVRAGLMGCLVLGAQVAGRPGAGLTALAFAAAALTAVNPLAIKDVAFQLSFAATAGLFLLAPAIEPRIVAAFARTTPLPVARVVGGITAMCLAAGIAVFPITATAFDRVSLVAVPANVLAVPLFEAVIITSAATALAGVAWQPAGEALGQVAALPTSAMTAIARAFAGLPGASLDIAVDGTLASLAILAATVLAGLTLVRLGKPAQAATVPGANLSPRLTLAAVPLLAAAVVWADLLWPQADILRVAVLDIGQGDAVLITTPRGQRILVDGGPSGPALLARLADEMPGASRRIDLVVLTHPQDDHAAGLVAVTQRFDVRLAMLAPGPVAGGASAAWLEALAANGTPLRRALAGDVASLGGGVSLEVLWPDDAASFSGRDDVNNRSVVLRLSYGRVSFLLTGDLAADGERALLAGRGDVSATILKVGHHGSDGASTEEFLRAVRPAVAVLSAGAANPYGQPSPSTLLRLAGVPLLRTDRNGTVRFESDGRRLWAQPSRGGPQVVPVSAAR